MSSTFGTLDVASSKADVKSKMEKSVICSLAILSLIGLIDAISYMAVGPSLIFYVNDLGGTKEQYGVIMSTFSFASFCFKPIYGRWVDMSGNKYRFPFFVSFSAAILGNFIYFSAILLPTATTKFNYGVWALLAGRFMAGMGAANNALGFSYIATVIPHDRQTTVNVLLSMTRIVGMTLGPFVNVFLGQIDTELRLGENFVIPLNPNNSVGLFVAAGQMLVLIVTLLFFNEPPEVPDKIKITDSAAERVGRKQFWEAVSNVEIVIPMIIIFVVNCNFQLVETAFPPAVAHALGWGPVQTSSVMGANALFMFFLMMFVMFLSIKHVSDMLLVGIGSFFGMLGGLLMYCLWTYQAPTWHFILPIIISTSGFPFISSSNRSNFTKAVKSKPELENAQSMMQAIMSMGASVGGFVAPSFVAAFVLKSPEEVLASEKLRELTKWAWYVPISSTLCILGLWYQSIVGTRNEKAQMEAVIEPPSETSGLLRPNNAEKRRSSVVEINQEFSRKNEVYRRSSAQIMGIACPFENEDEKEIRDRLWKEKKELEELREIDTLLE